MVLSTPVDLVRELDRLTIAHFETPEFRHLLSVPITLARAQCYVLHRAHFQRNRRTVWPYVQAAVPLDLKHMIWEHEREELDYDPRAGSDHITLGNRECEALGLRVAEIESAEL